METPVLVCLPSGAGAFILRPPDSLGLLSMSIKASRKTTLTLRSSGVNTPSRAITLVVSNLSAAVVLPTHHGQGERGRIPVLVEEPPLERPVERHDDGVVHVADLKL